MSKDKTDKTTVQWLDAPEDHDYPAAESYLALQFDHDHAAQLATQLRAAKPTQFKAKDVFRASRLSLLGVSNSHVEKVKKKVLAGTALSPILLVRAADHNTVIVADGYHRMCAIYTFDEDAWLPCRIVSA